ncbi:MAG: uroporphyrinogen decarboxylase family protein [Phycisphaerae bacterium]
MTNRERLMATLNGKSVDRPAVNFYEIGGIKVTPSDPSEFNIYNHPSWQPLLQLAEQETDLIRTRNPWLTGKQNDARHQFMKVEQFVQNGNQFIRTIINIGGRTLMSLTRRDPEVDTVWTIEHLLKDIEDLKAYIRLPDDLFEYEPDISELIQADLEVGDRGIVMVDTSDPLCMGASLFSMEDYTVIALTEQSLFHALLEKLSRSLYLTTEKVAKRFPGHLWRIFGPEYASEPYLPPYLFKEYVVRYVEPMVQTIQKYGGFARIHCHGRIQNILPYIIQMGACGIDPIEPPPQGDMELSKARLEYGKDLVLFGNLEINDIEYMKTNDFKKVVLKSLTDGTRGEGRGFVLMPSASPYGRIITGQTMANYSAIVELTKSFVV